MTPQRLIRPRCCSRGTACIYLLYSDDELYKACTQEEFIAFVQATPPRWYLPITPTSPRPREPPPIIDCYVEWCPFCGAKLPTPIRNRQQRRMAIILAGGYYCAACKQQLNTCRCPTPEQQWRTP